MILKMLFITVDVVNEISSGGEAATPIYTVHVQIALLSFFFFFFYFFLFFFSFLL